MNKVWMESHIEAFLDYDDTGTVKLQVEVNNMLSKIYLKPKAAEAIGKQLIEEAKKAREMR